MNSRDLKMYRRQRGLSLVELMVAIVISIILMAGVIQIYLSSKQSYRITSNQARMQENGRFAMHFLSTDIRQAGYTGCASLNRITPNVIANPPPTAPVYDLDNFLRGLDYTAASVWPADFPSKPANLVAGTSVILLGYGSPSSAFLKGNLGVTNANIQVNANAGGWQAGDYMFITDCSSADLFRATSVSNGTSTTTIAHASNMNTSNRLSKLYGTDAQLMAFTSEMYYIGTSNGRQALYRVGLDGVAQQLVDNVQDMQLLYGVATGASKSVTLWLTATQVATANDWSKVVAVRVNLLMTTPDDHLTPTAQSIPFNGGTFNAADKRLYWTFGDTVTVRNRVN